jgi:SpoVK/Ycf46/Vps4 family AAA+-type ATPase
MATAGDSIRKLIQSHIKGDEEAFRSAAHELIADERRKNHKMFALELEKLLGSGTLRALSEPLNLGHLYNGSLPKDKERGLPLVEIREPHRMLEDLILTDSVRSQLDRIVIEQRKADELKMHGLKPLQRLLFCGPPGCGKSVTAEAMAQALYLPLVIVRFDAIISSYLGETAANLRKVFDFASTYPVVLFLDEFDAVGKERSSEDEHGELKRVVTSLLQMLDAMQGDSITIAASNHQGLLDSALWRRFDDIILFDRPNLPAIKSLLKRCLARIRKDDLDLESWANKLKGRSHADVERVAVDALKLAVLDGREKLTQADVDSANLYQRRRDASTGSSSVN